MEAAVGKLAGCRILVVEDEPLIALDIQETLEREGATVIGPAALVSDALALVEQIRPDAAVLDVRLGGDATTFPVAAWLSRQGVPFIFQTSDPGIIDVAYCDVPLLRKPFSSEQLLAKVTDLLAVK